MTKRTSTKPEAFEDSFTTEEATFSVEVGLPWGDSTEAVKVSIDCRGQMHGDEEFCDLLIEMLTEAKRNLAARRGKLTRKRLAAL